MPDAASCICATLRDLAVVPMGGEGLDERFFATIEMVRSHGGAQWWLYLGRCTACGQHWMVAQEERIYDDHFVKRLTPEEADAIVAEGRWPADFLTYEAVLRLGQERSSACQFFDPRSDALLQTIEDLRGARPDISATEIGGLLGISDEHVAILMRPEGLFDRVVRKLRG
jgi:hypothetical protein